MQGSESGEFAHKVRGLQNYDTFIVQNNMQIYWNLRGEGNSYRGLGMHVPTLFMGKFAVFCPGYG